MEDWGSKISNCVLAGILILATLSGDALAHQKCQRVLADANRSKNARWTGEQLSEVLSLVKKGGFSISRDDLKRNRSPELADLIEGVVGYRCTGNRIVVEGQKIHGGWLAALEANGLAAKLDWTAAELREVLLFMSLQGMSLSIDSVRRNKRPELSIFIQEVVGTPYTGAKVYVEAIKLHGEWWSALRACGIMGRHYKKVSEKRLRILAQGRLKLAQIVAKERKQKLPPPMDRTFFPLPQDDGDAFHIRCFGKAPCRPDEEAQKNEFDEMSLAAVSSLPKERQRLGLRILETILDSPSYTNAAGIAERLHQDAAVVRSILDELGRPFLNYRVAL